MTRDEFNGLTEIAKKELLVDAKKITERQDEVAKFTVFQIDKFYVEVSSSVIHKFRRILKTYHSIKDLPVDYGTISL